MKEKKTVWFELWRKVFMELNRFQPFEMLMQPFGEIYMLSSEDPIINTLKQLYHY